ncbi:uncharacterized protein CCDC7 isoform X2 [Paroedura picta]|uniref:uncharacterized protein CCDC7 isoform X2 n=1 Tax=Paroedura picta TaxID=143630 RepID=UPI004056D47B
MKSTKQVNQTLIQPPIVLDNFSPALKKKGKLKHELEPMVIMTSDAPENIAQYSLDIPSANKDRVLDEMDMLKNITVHLNQIVQTMEHVYSKDVEIKEAKEVKREEEETLHHEREDMVCFLIFCSQLSNQLDASLREEKLILESLLKWFEKEVQMLEELGEEEIIPDWQVPVADKNITDNINKLMNRIQRLEELKGRVQELPKYIRASTPREKRKQLAPPPTVVKDPKRIIEELAMKHTTEDVMNMAQVFQDESGAPQTIESMNSRMVEIMKVFERQTNKLHRITNEQDVLEGKLQKIQRDFRKLAEEKQIMEDELQKMKISDVTIEKASADTRKKLLAKLEKEKPKVEEKPGAQPEKGKRFPQKAKDSEAVKMKEDLAKAQANIQSLEREKKMLEDKLQKVLEESDIASSHFAEIPPDTPDWEFPYAPLEENEKDLSKKSKKGVKLKGKPSVIDGTVQKVTKFDTVKVGETLPGKGQEISTLPQAKVGKGKKKGTDLSEVERTSLHKIPSTVSEKLQKQPGKSETPSKSDVKGTIKQKESVELKKRPSALKGTGKETPGSADIVLPPLPPDQEKQLLPDSTAQQAEEQKEMLPTIISSAELQEQTVPAIESERAGLVPSLLAESEEFMGESERLTLKKAAATPRTWADITGLKEAEIKDLIDEGMLQLADHLTELEGMPEAETLAKLLLEPSKTMEALPYAQKLHLINQLLAPEGQEQAQFPVPVEEGQIAEQREKKRRVLANIASTLNLLDQTQAEAEEEDNETAKMRKILLAELDTNLKDLQQVQEAVPTQQDLENNINDLTQKRSLLISALESNLLNLKEAQAFAATQPSEMSKNKVKELLQERAALTTCLETNDQELQEAKSQQAILVEKIKQEEEVNELSEKRRLLVAELEKNLNDLQEAQNLAVIEPGSKNDEKIKELTEQSELLAASLATNLQDLERAQAYVPGLGEESRLQQEKINELSEEKKTLLDNLKSNLKDLQEAQALAAVEPSAVNDEKIKELAEQRKLLTACLETNLQELQRAQGYVPDLGEESRLKEIELNEQTEKKRNLQERLESNLKNLQQVQMLATIQPDSMNELKLQELIEERKYLTTELEAAGHVIQEIQHEKELNELSQKKQLLLKDLESNLKDLKAVEALAAVEPGSIAEHKLQELTEQRRHLAAELDTALHQIEELQTRDEMVKTPELELQELSDKKKILLGKLESTLKDLQQAQALASAEAGGGSEQKLRELTQQRKQLTAELESAILDMQEIQLRDEILKSGEKEVRRLLEKKQLVLENLLSTFKELQAGQAAAAAQPGSFSEEKLQVLREQGRRLTADLETVTQDIKRAQQRALGRDELVTSGDQKLYDLSERKQVLLQNLSSNLKELEQVQALASSEPDSSTELQMQKLNEQRKLLSASLDSIIQQIKEAEDHRVSETKIPAVLKMDLNQLAQFRKLFLESLEINLKDLEEAQTLAAAHPGSIADQRVQELIEERGFLATSLKTILEDMEDVENEALKKDAIIRTREIILKELYQKQQLVLENLEINWRDLQQAEALAATQPEGIGEENVKKLTEQRRCLASELEAVMQDIQDAEGLDKVKWDILEIIDRGLAELSDDRKQLWKNVELNLNDLKGLQGLVLSEPGVMQEERKQMLAAQRKCLAAGLEALLQDMEEKQNLILSGDQVTSPDEKTLSELFQIKSLESKLDEIMRLKGISDSQLDFVKGKLCNLKAKSGLDRWDLSLEGPLSLTKEEIANYELDDEAAGKLGKKRCWSPYLQKSIKDMQQKSIRELQQKSIRDLQQKSMILQRALRDKPVEDKSLEECLVSVPLQMSEKDIIFKYGPDDEQLAKRRALVAKLEANIKDLQAFQEAQQMKRAREKFPSETSSEFLKPAKSGFQLQIRKAPEVKKPVTWHDVIVPKVSETESETSIESQPDKLQRKDTEQELRKHFVQRVKKTSLPYELTIEKRDMYNAVQEILDSNRELLPVRKANLPQAQSQLREANLIAAQKLLYSQPPSVSTARFHEYSVQPPRSAWEGTQLPATNYLQKLIALKKRLLSPELKGLLEISSSSTSQGPKSAATDEKRDSMLICGKGYKGSRHGITLPRHS